MNKRLMPRLRKRLKLWLSDRQAYTADVSPTGLKVELMSTPRPGAQVHGRLEVAGVELPFTGEVCWVKQAEPRLSVRGRVGIRFTGIDPRFFALFQAA